MVVNSMKILCYEEIKVGNQPFFKTEFAYHSKYRYIAVDSNAFLSQRNCAALENSK